MNDYLATGLPPVHDGARPGGMGEANQAALRGSLIARHGGRCVISGCTELLALDAAHIDPVSKKGADHPDNGLLLRADLHRHLRCWAAHHHLRRGKLRVALASDLRDSEYARRAGHPVEGLTQGQRTRLKARNRGWSGGR